MTKLVDIFLQPSKVFAAERERPTYLLPWMVLVAFTVAFTLAYFLRVDPGWYADHMFDASGAQMTAKEAAQARAMMPGARSMALFGTAGTVVSLAIMFAITGLYFWLASKLTGRGLTYRHGLSLATWGAMPAALGAIIALVGALTMSPQTGMESLMLTHVDPLIVQLPNDARWNKLAQNADLLSLWTIFLGALGWRTFTRSGWGQAILVSVLPLAIIYGVMALIAR
ncbi:YIP1 family protein [Lysobacter xanthus]